MSKPTKAAWSIEHLAKRHDRSHFDCGEATLSGWIKTEASQYERKDLARCYVAVRPGERLVCGYYTLSSRSVRPDLLPDEQAKGLPRSLAVPVVLIGRLAVDRSVQGQGLGGILLLNALNRTRRLAEEVGVRAIEVDASDDRARAFYQHYGFLSLRDDTRHLYLPMQVVRKLPAS